MSFYEVHITDIFNADEILELRRTARLEKNWTQSDYLRKVLEDKLIFVFDVKDGQEVYFLTESYFRNKHKKDITKSMNNREYVEWRIKEDIKAEKIFDAWIYSTKESK